MKTLSIQWQWRPAMLTGVGFAEQNVWSRAARRRQTSQGSPREDNSWLEGKDEMAFGFKIQAKQGKDVKGIEVVIRWLKGNDSVLFESFCGMLKRQVENR